MTEEQPNDEPTGPEPADNLFQRAQFNWLALAVFMSAVLGAVLLFTWNNRRLRADEREFYDSLGSTQFAFKPADSTQRFQQLRDSLPETLEDPQTARQLHIALFQRAVDNAPQILKFQEEASAIQSMYSRSMISASAWRSFRENDVLVNQELDEVRDEAEELIPGWSKAIWQQAVQQLQQKEKIQAQATQEEDEKKSQAKKARRLKQKEKIKASKKATAASAPSPEELAEKARLELEVLLKSEERRDSVAGSTHSKGGKKKK